MDREKLRDKVKKDIRALLISAPLGVPAHIFAKDYRQMNGKEVPYREIGHRSLDDFIMSIPDVVRVGTGPTGLVTFYPIATRETQHIVNMIRRQKKPSIKKAVIPSAIVARKNPVKMSSFSRRGGNRTQYNRRGGGGGGGGNYRSQGKHPRSHSQPASSYQPPNLPPRLQRTHQQSATFQPRFHAVSQPAPSSQTWTGGGFGGGQQQQGGGTRFRPDEGQLRHRTGSASDNPGNRLHPQHTLNSFSAANRSAPKPASPTAAPALSNLNILWKDEFHGASLMTVEELNHWTRTDPKTPAQNPVCVEGVTSRQKEDMFQDKAVLKILLLSRKGKPGVNASLTDAVQLHFTAPHWDLKTYRQPYDLPEGIKLKVYGIAFAVYIKTKDKAQPAIKVLYYEKMEEGTSSPQVSRPTTPKIEAKLSVLEENIFKLLLKLERGTYAKRLGKVYQSEYTTAPPENILELAKKMPFVRIERINPANEIMHLKDEYRKQDVVSLPGTVSFSDDASDHLYEVLVCLVNSPFSFYVQIRDDNQGQALEEMEEQMNKHFSNKPLKKEDVVVKENQLYASLWGDEEEGQWCRALVINQQDSKANVVYPDYGNTEWVTVSELRYLPPQFYELPFQAIHCCLHGVLMKDKMMSSEAADYFSELAAEKICALHVVDSSGARVSVEILDKQLDDDENINSKLISKFHPIASLSPKLPSPGEPMVAVKLTDIDETGILSIQVVGPGLSQLEELTKQIEERCSTSKGDTVTPVVGGLYCSKYSRDDCWYRVRVMEVYEKQRKVLIQYVDYGNDEQVDQSKLRPKLDTLLFSLPPQVVKCKLAGIPPAKGKWTDSAFECVVQYIDIDELNLEVVDYNRTVTDKVTTALPVVKLHVRNSDQEMVCINDIMLQDLSLFGLPPLKLPSFKIKPRTTGSVSSAVDLSSPLEGVVGQRSRSVSSLPPTLPEEVSSDAVFDSQSLTGNVHIKVSTLSSSSSSSGTVHGHLNDNGLTKTKSRSTSPGVSTEAGAAGAGGDVKEISSQMHMLQVGNESCNSSSISSLNQSGSEVDSEDALGDEGDNESPNLPTSAQTTQKLTPINMNKLTLVNSPKECIIKSDVPYNLAAMEDVVMVSQQSGHVVAPPSATRTTATSSTSPNSLQIKPPSVSAPHPNNSSPFLMSPHAPMTPPVSPPPVTTAVVKVVDDKRETVSEGSGAGGMRLGNWEELPRGKCVEVVVSWAPSPTNFTLLLLSCKQELESMSDQLQQLVALQPYPSQQLLSTGYMCAARYSQDMLWYRAIVRQPFQLKSTQVEVEFLDYGGSELVPLSALKCLPEQCKRLPFQAIKAFLYGIRGDVSLNPAMVKKFEEMVLNKHLYAAWKDFDSDSSRVSVVLLDTSDSSGKDIIINEAFTSFNP